MDDVAVNQSPTLGALFEALAKAQGQMTSSHLDGTNPHFNSRYATLDSIWEAIRKPLADNGLTAIQTLDEREERPVLITTLGHSSGEWITSRIRLILSSIGKDSGPATMQSLGSAITYARRQGLAAITGAVSDADDDGNEASRSGQAPPPGGRQPTSAPPVPGEDRAGHTDYHCAEHKTDFFKSAKMKNFAHPIKDANGQPVLTDDGKPAWHNMPEAKPSGAQPIPVTARPSVPPQEEDASQQAPGGLSGDAEGTAGPRPTLTWADQPAHYQATSLIALSKVKGIKLIGTGGKLEEFYKAGTYSGTDLLTLSPDERVAIRKWLEQQK